MASGILKRNEWCAVRDLPGKLPVKKIDDDVDASAVAEEALKRLDNLQAGHLTADALWRDLWALTDDLRQFHKPRNVAKAWADRLVVQKPVEFTMTPGSATVVRIGDKHAWVQTWFSFRTVGNGKPSRCSAILAVVPDGDGDADGETAGQQPWKIWMLSTILEQLDGFHNPDEVASKCTHPSQPAVNGHPDGGVDRHSPTGAHVAVNGLSSTCPYDCVVVGAGYSGLTLAARLDVLSLNYVTLERNAELGDNWTHRYDSVKLHTTKEYSQFPLGRSFDHTYPEYLDAKALARGYRQFAKEHDLNISLGTALQHASWNKTSRLWTVQVRKGSRLSEITTKHLVFCLGAGGAVPKMPHVPNRELYKGDVIHSGEWKSAHRWKGQKGVVIGSANTAHDMAEDMLAAQLSSVTMVQRDRTAIYTGAHLKEFSDAHYGETLSIEEGDRATLALPTGIARDISMATFQRMIRRDAAHFDALEKAGFKADRRGDNIQNLFERLGGHYVDVGASKKIADGLIKIKSGVTLSSYTPAGVEFDDGTTLDADVVVFATGFEGNLKQAVSQLVDPEAAAGLDDYWGVDAEGNLRGAYRPMPQPNIWFHGGPIPMARFYGRFVALQILADARGVPMQPYATETGS